MSSPSPSKGPLTAIAMLSSKRVRVALVTAVAFLTAVGFAHRYGALPDLRTMWTTPGHGGAEGAENNRDRPAVAPAVGQPPEHNTDWSRFAYVQYVTNSAYLCNSVMLFETLHRFGTSRADRVMMYPAHMVDPTATTATTHDGRLLLQARDDFNVKLVPIAVQERHSVDCTSALPLLSHLPSLSGLPAVPLPG